MWPSKQEWGRSPASLSPTFTRQRLACIGYTNQSPESQGAQETLSVGVSLARQ